MKEIADTHPKCVDNNIEGSPEAIIFNVDICQSLPWAAVLLNNSRKNNIN